MPSDRWHADLPFRGSRPYVHSAAICNHLRDRFGSAARFELVMRDLMASRVLFAPLEDVTNAKATLRIDDHSGGTRRYGLVDDPEHPVTVREPYDEDGLVAGAVVENRVVTVADTSAGSVFDRMVAANKAVINQTLDPGVKLIAAKIVLDGFPADDQPFQLRLDSHLGTRIFRSSVLMNGAKAGEIVYYGQ